MYRSTLFFILFFLPFLVKSQENLPKLFIKCDRCDQTYLRKEINYVDHVRDQALANIQLLYTEIEMQITGTDIPLILLEMKILKKKISP